MSVSPFPFDVRLSACCPAELEGSQVREAHRDQRLLGLMQDLSSRVTTTENYAFNMNEVMHALQAVHAGPEFPEMPAITHDHWGFIVPAERPSNWTVQDRTPNNGVITTIINSLQQYNPNLVEDTNFSVAGAFAPAVLAQGNIVPAQDNSVPAVPAGQQGENEVPVQDDQEDVTNGAASHD
eukprot:5519525-Amphidinium_carterae.1